MELFVSVSGKDHRMKYASDYRFVVICCCLVSYNITHILHGNIAGIGPIVPTTNYTSASDK